MLDADGPNWYRGAALCNEASESDVSGAARRLGVKRLVIGHTVTRNQRVSPVSTAPVIKLDTGMNRAGTTATPPHCCWTATLRGRVRR